MYVWQQGSVKKDLCYPLIINPSTRVVVGSLFFGMSSHGWILTQFCQTIHCLKAQSHAAFYLSLFSFSFYFGLCHFQASAHKQVYSCQIHLFLWGSISFPVRPLCPLFVSPLFPSTATWRGIKNATFDLSRKLESTIESGTQCYCGKA